MMQIVSLLHANAEVLREFVELHPREAVELEHLAARTDEIARDLKIVADRSTGGVGD